MKYWTQLWYGIRSSLWGLRLSFRHLRHAGKRHSPSNVFQNEYFQQSQGLVTLQYPKETLALPDHGRYQLHNEIDDCIVCDKCAKICPVDCIEIESIKATEQIGTASDGSPIRLYAAKFDIDMAKCCFCGLCTTVCPTECLTMKSEYDFSSFEIQEMNFQFGNLSPTEAEEKRKLLEEYQKEKAELKAQKTISKKEEAEPQPEKEKTKVVFKPKAIVKTVENQELKSEENQESQSQSVIETETKSDNQTASQEEKPKPVFRPKMKPKIQPKNTDQDSE
jgi:formate hydrogenlyase subunit 6/NADH:ubiquinone oxidoreductase subunit I